MHLPRLLFIVGVAALTACKLSTEAVPNIPLGIMLISDTADAQGNPALGPVGHFFSGSGVIVPDSRLVQDSCVVIPYLADTGAFPYNQFTGVDAGDSITVQTSQASAQLRTVVDQIGTPLIGTYSLPNDSLIPFTPGTPVTVTIPGAASGFPQSSVSAPSAADYTVGPIDTVPASDSFHITWAPASGSGSAMVFVLSFDTTSAAGGPVPVELYCAALDTGDALVPVLAAKTWLKALPGSRAIRSYRWQTTGQTTDSASLVIIAQHNKQQVALP